ncbi:hypothetical protein [Zobellella sp. An-6]|uniref:hypothetical protein n=1 Tax=Zobellella sp. An-6 TaxID=3400218 RepID=UPI0040428954
MNKSGQAKIFIERYESIPSSQEEYEVWLTDMSNVFDDLGLSEQRMEFRVPIDTPGILVPKRMRNRGNPKLPMRPEHESNWESFISMNAKIYETLKRRLSNRYYEEKPMSATHFHGPVNAQNLQTGANSNITQTFNAETITLQELVKLIEEKGTPEERSQLGTFLQGLTVAGSIEGLKLLLGA